ncbi:MAG: hypothetical protein AAGF85_22170, partial [Bacteroidota bacterium]
GMRDSSSILDIEVTQILESPYTKSLRFNRSQRKATLIYIVDFYKTYIDGFGNLKSLDVLRSVF